MMRQFLKAVKMTPSSCLNQIQLLINNVSTFIKADDVLLGWPGAFKCATTQSQRGMMQVIKKEM